MNIDNLLKAADFVEAIPPVRFRMEVYREGDLSTISCDSVGCALGHLTALFPEHIEYDGYGEINFLNFADNAFDISDPAFMWCFASEWGEVDNTPTGCAERLRFLATNGEKAAEKAWLSTRSQNNIN